MCLANKEDFESLPINTHFIFSHDLSLVESCDIERYKFVQINYKTGDNTYIALPNCVHIDKRKYSRGICKKNRGFCYPKAYVHRVNHENKIIGQIL